MAIRAGVAFVDILPRMTAFQTALSKQLDAAAGKMNVVGKHLTKTLTLPIVAAGAAAVKLAADFESSMTKIKSLVGLSAEEVNKMSDAVLKLAPAVGKGPKELAEALYFITSSGIPAARAMDVLKESAKASAAGLGETKVIADAVTSAVNAYGSENLTAAQATDILIAAVREGKGEPQELARSIGRVIPIAAEMGVEFDQVGAALAGLTRTGLNAHEAVTALRQFLVLLTKPAQQSRAALDELGLTAGDVAQITQRLDLSLAKGGLTVAKLRDEVANKGLFEGMISLKTALGQNRDALGQVLPNVRALAGFLSLTGFNAEENAGIFKRLAAATGSTNKAFAEASQTAQFKFNQALSALKVAGIEAGGIIIPVLLQLAQQLTKVAQAFTALPKGAQETIIKVLALTAAVGPLLRVLSYMTRTVDLVIRGFTGLVRIIATVQFNIQALAYAWQTSSPLVGAAAAGIVASIAGVIAIMNKVKEANDETANSFITKTIPTLLQTGNTLDIVSSQWRSGPFGGNDIKRTADVFNRFGRGVITTAQAFKELAHIAGVGANEMQRVAIEQIRTALLANTQSKEFSQLGTIISTSLQLGIINAAQLGQILGENAIQGERLATVLSAVPAALRGAVTAAAKATKPLDSALGALGIQLPDLPRITTGGGLLGGKAADRKRKLEEAKRERENFAEELAKATGELLVPNFKQILARPLSQALPQVADAMAGLKDRLVRLTEVAVEGQKKGLVSAATVDRLRALNRTASSLSARLAALNERLQAMNSAISAGFDRFSDFGDALKDATPASILKNFADRARSAQLFGDLLRKAAARGLSADIIQQAAAQGPEALGFLQAISQLSDAQIKELNAQQAAINKARDATIKALDEKYFGPAFRQLASEIDKFAKTLGTFVTELKNIIKKIAPSIKLQHGGLVTRPTIALIGEKKPEAVIPLDQLGGVAGGAGGVVNIYPQALIGTRTEVMNWVREAMYELQRRNSSVRLT